jgi:hypothetical protein
MFRRSKRRFADKNMRQSMNLEPRDRRASGRPCRRRRKCASFRPTSTIRTIRRKGATSMKIAALTACAIAGLLATMPNAGAQTGAGVRSLDEVKAEVMRRAGRINPFEGVRRDDAEKVLASLASLDPDAWG